MLFSKLKFVSALAFANIVSSQVIVTVTNTITVVTVTVTPKTTSTSTAYVTVTGTPPHPSSSTSTATVTVTVSAAPSPTQATCPIQEWGQCGGAGYNGNCGQCASDAVCKYKDVWYSYCSNLPKVVNVVSTIYKP
ncbi:hypothetical protein EG329_003013 [Mollisiaceae sp. DMI_Dod_QoI]|nr:hypothetical protein EG329_003013 [Helotiales sp. DMI_Dod_QoI]